MDAIVELLIAQHNQGLDVALVLDKTQATGTYEMPEITKLKQAGVPMMIGTSSQRKIMHNKFTVLDDEWVQSGSWNYTNSASKEDNFFDIEHSPTRAVQFTIYWQKMWDWIKQNDPQT